MGDVDGVLNTSQGLGAGPLEELQICLLVRLLERADARIVLSSAWRERWDLKLKLLAALTKAGARRDCIVGQTPVISHEERAREVLAWLERYHLHGPQRWVILDDKDLGFSKCD